MAWHPLGWEAVAYSEIERFPSEVLAHHYPSTPNLGDMTKFKEWNFESDVDLLVGGTPCQSFSVAGLRKGLDDPRGNLMLTYLAIADKYRPRWLVWENVPGVLSSNGGKDFGVFLGALGELGYGFAYRILDAQYFGVAQRRRRVFVVGYLGDWRVAAAVLFERHSLQGHPAPSREARKEVTECAGTLTANGGGLNRPAGNANELDFCVTVDRKWPADISSTLDTTFGAKQGLEDQHVNAGCPMFVPSPAYGIPGNWIGRKPENGGNATEPMHDVAPCLTKADQHGVAQPIAYAFDSLASNSMKSSNPISGCNEVDVSKALDTSRGLDPSCNQGGIGVAQPIPLNSMNCFRSPDADASTGCGIGEAGEAMFTITKANSHAVAQPIAFSGCDDGMDTQINVTLTMRVAGNAQGNLAVAVGTDLYNGAITGDVAVPMTNRADGTGTGPTVMQAVAFSAGNSSESRSIGYTVEGTPPLRAGASGTNQVPTLMQAMAVRRLTPVECERLQGFPDSYTDIKSKDKPTPDGPRYKALGNSMAVPVMAWIGQRIQEVEAICKQNK